MKLIIGGESALGYLERLAYDGVIGLFYNTTWQGVLAYIIVGTICILAVIGLFAVIKSLFRGKKKSKDPGKKWLRTGKY